MGLELWGIFVPKADNSGVEFPLEHHHLWDENVRSSAGGLTILKTAKGVWTSPAGDVFKEEMIPVQIACEEWQLDKIIDFTLVHYNQEAVMAYRISEYVIIRHR